MFSQEQIRWLILVCVCYSICLLWFYKKMKRDLLEDEKSLEDDDVTGE